MDESWLSVADAARELELSPGRVRSLLDSGALHGRKLGGSWFVDPQAVQRRSAHSGKGGRPLSPGNAWLLLALLTALPRPDAGLSPADQARLFSEAQLRLPANPVDRSRLRKLLADLPEPEGLARRLASRAKVRRMRAHPGVLDRLQADDRVSVGGGRAVAALGGGLAAGGSIRLYVPAADVDALVRKYRLRDDIEGNIELAVIPEDVNAELRPEQGRPVPLAVAWADLLDDPDARARGAAHDWAARLPRTVSIPDGRKR